MQQLMDSAAIRLLGILFTPSETARLHPIETHWTTDWDVATILKALEVLYPMRPEDRYLAHSSKWHQVVIETRQKARIRSNDLDQSRRDTIHEWSTAEDSIGPIPDLNNDEILKDLSRCFTSKDNPAGTSTSNVQFQCDLSTIIRADNEYHSNPTLGRLCEMIAGIMTHGATDSGNQPHGWTRPQRALQYRQQVKDPKASRGHSNLSDEYRRGDRW